MSWETVNEYCGWRFTFHRPAEKKTALKQQHWAKGRRLGGGGGGDKKRRNERKTAISSGSLLKSALGGQCPEYRAVKPLKRGGLDQMRTKYGMTLYFPDFRNATLY